MSKRGTLLAALLAAALTAAADATGGAPAEGELRRIDRQARKLTIRHGPIPQLDMPAMTMVFQVADAALLERARPGAKIRFRVEKRGAQYVVTEIEAVD